MKKKKILTREDFVKYWANWVRTHPDKEWSRQQNIIIDSQIKSAIEFYRKNRKAREKFLKMIRENQKASP